jgi:hypothetical protein
MSLLLLAALFLPGEHPGGPVPTDLAKVVLMKLITDIDTPKLVLCLQINGRNPPTSTLRELQRPDRIVVAGSECHDWEDTQRGSWYRKTGAPAHFLRVSDAIWKSKSNVEVQAQDHFHGKWARYWVVRLVRANGVWKIVSFTLEGEA